MGTGELQVFVGTGGRGELGLTPAGRQDPRTRSRDPVTHLCPPRPPRTLQPPPRGKSERGKKGSKETFNPQLFTLQAPPSPSHSLPSLSLSLCLCPLSPSLSASLSPCLSLRPPRSLPLVLPPPPSGSLLRRSSRAAGAPPPPPTPPAPPPNLFTESFKSRGRGRPGRGGRRGPYISRGETEWVHARSGPGGGRGGAGGVGSGPQNFVLLRPAFSARREGGRDGPYGGRGSRPQATPLPSPTPWGGCGNGWRLGDAP